MSNTTSDPPPYAPSWVNRVNHLVSRAPVPFGIVYLAAWLALLGLITLLRWHDGVYPTGTFSVSDLVLTGTGIFFVGLVHYLDQWTEKKLTTFRWALSVDDRDYSSILRQLVTMPARPALIASLIAFAFAIFTLIVTPVSYQFLALDLSSWSGAVQLINFLFSWCAFGALSYHAIRQLRLGSAISTQYLNINLFQLDPLYAFAALAQRTALGWLIMAYAWALTTPALLEHPAIMVTVMFMQGVAIVTFILPLLGVHALLEQEKNRLRREIGRRMEATIHGLQRDFEAKEAGELTKLNATLSSLVIAETRLDKVSTWPWQPETLRWLVAAIVLPIAMWVFQNFMQRFILK